MRPLVITQNVTADGSIDMLDDWFDPQEQSAEMLEINARDSAQCDALVLGRQTFEDFRGYWPEQTDDRTGVSEELDGLDKYVVSTTITDPGWQRSTIISGDPVAAVRDLKSAHGGGEIVVTGSVSLCHTLIAAGVVDGYRLWTYPYVQGRGRRLFPDGYSSRLRLEESLAFATGVTYTHWTTRADRSSA
ncbi:MAG: dihydrofolate reductase family protein [Janibacter sp.]